MNTAATQPNAPQEVSFDDALQMAVQLHRNNQLEGAVQLYQRLLDAAPGHPDVLHLMGMARHQMGQSDEGVSLIERAIEAEPRYAGYFNNLGNIYMARGEVAKALGAYQQAVELDQGNADLHNNLGALYKAQRQFDEAHASYERAMQLDPRHVSAHNNMGLLYAEKGDRPGAITYYIKALELLPGDASARRLLGTTYYAMGRIADAGEVYRQWLAQEPEHPTARHMYAACTGQGVPERAPDDYVEQAFDHFAESFESVLNERLNYQAPQLCADMLARHLPPPPAPVRDAGRRLRHRPVRPADGALGPCAGRRGLVQRHAGPRPDQGRLQRPVQGRAHRVPATLTPPVGRCAVGRHPVLLRRPG